MNRWTWPPVSTSPRHVFSPLSPNDRAAAPESAKIRVGENGRIHGVDGMLDQIAGALSKHAGPMLVRDVLPAVRRDAQLQARIGAAVGQSFAREVAPWLAIGVGALAAIALVQILRS